MTDKNIKLLIVSQYYLPDITAPSFRIAEMARLLAEKGYDITIITARPHRVIVKDSEYKDIKGIRVIRVPIYKNRGRGLFDFLLHYITFQFAAIAASLLVKRPSMVIATSPPLFAGFAGWVISCMKFVPFMLDIRDLWPDSAVSYGQLREGGIPYHISKKVEIFLYNRARLISCVAKPMAEYLKKETNPEKVFVVYNGIPEELLQMFGNKPEDIIATYTTKSDKDEEIGYKVLKIQYLGNFGIGQNLQLIVDAAEKLQQRNEKRFHFRLIGDGIRRSLLESAIKEKALDNIEIQGPFSKNEALHRMNFCDALVLTLKSDATMQRTIPSKLFDYMTTGHPILYEIRGEGGEILSESGGNVSFEPGSVDSFIDALIHLFNNYAELSQKALTNRDIVRARFTRERMVDELETRLLSVLN